MKIIKLIALLSFCLVVAPQKALAFSSDLRLTIVVVGDELTSNPYLPSDKRFPAQLEAKIRQIGFPVDVKNISLVETITADAVDNIDSIISMAPDIVILQLGETDIKRKLSPQTIYNNIFNMVNTLRSKNIYVLVMGTRAPHTYDPGYIQQIVQLFVKIGSIAQLYPYTLEGITGNSNLTIGDGYRPNAKGAAIMVEGIYRAVDAGLRWRLDIINRLAIKKHNESL